MYSPCILSLSSFCTHYSGPNHTAKCLTQVLSPWKMAANSHKYGFLEVLCSSGQHQHPDQSDALLQLDFMLWGYLQVYSEVIYRSTDHPPASVSHCSSGYFINCLCPANCIIEQASASWLPDWLWSSAPSEKFSRHENQYMLTMDNQSMYKEANLFLALNCLRIIRSILRSNLTVERAMASLSGNDIWRNFLKL